MELDTLANIQQFSKFPMFFASFFEHYYAIMFLFFILIIISFFPLIGVF